jgi:hypothetical protein
MLLDDNTGATAADRSARKKNEPDSELARRSIHGLKQLFRLHGTVQSARAHSSHPSSTNPGSDRASLAIHQPGGAPFSTSSDVSPKSRLPSHRHLAAKVGTSNRRHRISRVFSSVVSRIKRDSGVALSDAGDATQDNTDSESQCSENDEVYDEDAYSDDGQPGEHEHDRRNFLAIRAISRKAIEDFVLSLIYPDGELNSRTCHVTNRKEGSFHHAVFLAIEIGGKVEQEYVLKIPAHGTPQHWRPSDGFMLENEARLVQHIRHHTKCPVPEVVGYDEQLKNGIGAPYILKKKIDCIPAIDMWLGQPYKAIPNAEMHLHADDSSPKLEQKRITFLRSLA